MNNPAGILADIERALNDRDPRREGSEIRFRCPQPDRHTNADANPSARWNSDKHVWHCDACGGGGGYLDLARRLGIELPPASGDGARRIVATYDYRDEGGTLLYQAVRYEPKDFRQRRPDGEGGFVWDLKGMRRVLYRLPELLAAAPTATVFIVEGEKDVDALRARGLIATCNVGGAGKWRSEYNQYLRGRRVVIPPDNDAAGQQHAAQVAQSLAGTVAEVRILTLPDLPPKGDVSDWLASGGTRGKLEAMANAAPAWIPDAATSGLAFTSVGALLNEPDETAEWLVDGLLPAGGFVVLVGKPKAGKSTLARNLCAAIAQGEPFLGREIQQGRVLYLALEEKRSQVKAHFRALGVRSEAPLKVFVGTSPTDGLAQLAAALDQEPAVLVVIDPLFRFIRARDGNDYAAMTAALDPVLALAHKSGACLLVTHHAPKGERADIDAPIGSTAIAGSADVIMVLKRDDRYRTLSTVQRTGEDMPNTVIELDPVTRAVKAAGTRQEADVLDIKALLLEHIRTLTEPADEPTIQTAVEGRKQAKVYALRALLDEGEVERIGSGKRGNPYLYHVSGSPVPPTGGEPGNEKANSATNRHESSMFSGSRGSGETRSAPDQPERSERETEREVFEL